MRRNLWAVGVGAVLALATIASARADDSDVRAGLNIWRTKANCQICHGWAGDGQKMDNQMPDGANLRETTLDRDAILEVIKCGRPGRGMPAFDRLAYSDGRCYGMKLADVKAAGLYLTDPVATLQPREMDNVIEFLFAKVIGKGAMTKEKCADFWGAKLQVCDELP